MSEEEIKAVQNDRHLTYAEVYSILMESDEAYRIADRLCIALGTTCEQVNLKMVSGESDEKIK